MASVRSQGRIRVPCVDEAPAERSSNPKRTRLGTPSFVFRSCAPSTIGSLIKESMGPSERGMLPGHSLPVLESRLSDRCAPALAGGVVTIVTRPLPRKSADDG